MAGSMSRRDQRVIQFILWLAVATFLFGVSAIILGLRSPSPEPPASGEIVNHADFTNTPAH